MPIEILPSYLINQISAGEVIERPSSVVKELIENSIDSGANRIDIKIQKGGIKLIQIQDNGSGIIKDELFTAIKKHATSKIKSAKDLERIKSLGFRGEALTSISSISRFTLTSRTVGQDKAWKIYIDDHQSDKRLQPATHPIGTTVKVYDLFYNIAVRRKLMKSEKSEFNYINMIINQMLLCHFDIAISFSHNENLIGYYPAIVTETEKKKRLQHVCGIDFSQCAMYINYKDNGLYLYGWIIDDNIIKKVNSIKYCYVNKRVIKNQLINIAIKQACQSIIKNNQQPSYVIYLEINPYQIDVNIHPAKKEIRFHQPKLVHDFIIQGITKSFKSYKKTVPMNIPNFEKYKNKLNLDKLQRNNFFSLPNWYYRDDISDIKEVKKNASQHISIYKSQYLTTYSKIFGELLTIIKGNYALLKKNQKLILMSLTMGLNYLKKAQLKYSQINLKTRPLSIPLKIKINEYDYNIIKKNSDILNKIGIKFLIEKDHVTLLTIPLTFYFYEYNLQVLMYKMLNYLTKKTNHSIYNLSAWLASYEDNSKVIDWTLLRANILLAEIEHFCPDLLNKPPSNLIQYINIKNTIDLLNHDHGCM
ncbi:DNA mismatch repair endonuclease MutL [Candidatus Pantoea edessiphila]|uniref:DNA mismatch repair protein MutL n=1 Tax=Candidatus Pantoea edessiphila TaxID=2044610 RepID=A0A2P5SVS9_9GAMM|nr:DNA mismatch repair endonuclease MutL [Candidatus Pantoea edessiphila]PPI86439.1 DNA mismatch repair protein MutL [Candidatus Pantoea edessiphila]